MANPGAIRRPFVDVFQIYRQSSPLLARVDLPIVVVGLCRQVEFELEAGAHNVGIVSILPIPELTKFGAEIIDIDPIVGEFLVTEPDGSRTTVTSPALPEVTYIHPVFGRFIVPAADFTINNSTGEVTISASFNPVYTVAEGTRAAFTAEGSPLPGQRTFTDVFTDFLSNGVAIGDVITLADGNTFDVIGIQNEFTLIVTDGAGSTFIPGSTGNNLTYSIEKTLTTGAGSIIISYGANRNDRANELIEFSTRNDIFNQLGPVTPLNPLAMGADLAIRNSQRRVFALMLDGDNLAGHLKALDVLSTSIDAYGLAPLTQDETILTEYKNHVVAMSDPEKGQERVLWRTAKLDVQVTRDSAESFHSVVISGAGNDTALFSVLPGNPNVQEKGLKVGDLLIDVPTGGEARVLTITPAGASPDDDVTLTLSTPNSIPGNAVAATGSFATASGDNFNDADLLRIEDADGLSVQFEANRTGLNITSLGNTEVDISDTPATDGSFTCGTKATFIDGETVTMIDVFGTVRVFEVDVSGTHVPVVSGSIAVDISAGPIVSGTDVAGVFRTAINGITALNITAGGATAVVELAQDGTGIGGNTAVSLGGTPTGLTGKTDFSNGSDLSDTAVAALFDTAITSSGLTMGTSLTLAVNTLTQLIAGPTGNTVTPLYTPASGGTGIITIVPFNGGSGSLWDDWTIKSIPLTVEQQAIAIAQHTDDLDCLRIRNVWPDDVDMVFNDTTAGLNSTPGTGFWQGDSVIWLNAGGYWGSVMEASKRARFRPGLPLTGRGGAGIFRLRGVSDRFSRSQIDRIISTGTYVLEQPTGEGGAVQAIIATTSDDSDLATAFEMGIAQVDLYSKLVRRTIKPMFGRGPLDSNFLAALGIKLQAVANFLLRPEAQNAESISTRFIEKDPDRGDRVIMEVNFKQRQAANGGVLRIFVTA